MLCHSSGPKQLRLFVLRNYDVKHAHTCQGNTGRSGSISIFCCAVGCHKVHLAGNSMNELSCSLPPVLLKGLRLVSTDHSLISLVSHHFCGYKYLSLIGGNCCKTALGDCMLFPSGETKVFLSKEFKFLVSLPLRLLLLTFSKHKKKTTNNRQGIIQW